MKKKILKYIAYFLIILLLLFVVLALSIQSPAVQNRLVDYITPIISKNINAKVTIDQVRIVFPKTAVINGIYIEDQQKDTLLYAKKLEADVALFSLFNRTISFKNIDLDGAKINLYRKAVDSTYNFDFIIQQFQNTEPRVVDSTKIWDFNIAAVDITNSQIDFLDEHIGAQLATQIPQLALTANLVDFQKQIIDLEQIKLQEAFVNFQKLPISDSLIAVRVIDSSGEISFPEIPWDIQVDKLDIVDNQLIFDNQKEVDQDNHGIDFKHIEITDIDLLVENISWIDKNIQANIQQFNLTEKSGFELKEFSTDLKADSTQILADNLVIKTPYSEVRNTTIINFDELTDLVNLTNQVQLSSDFQKVALDFKDLKLFTPFFSQIKQFNTNLAEKLYLNGSINGNRNNLRLQEIDFSVGQQIKLKIDGVVGNLRDLETATFDVHLQELSTSYEKLKRLTDSLTIHRGLEEFGQFKLSTKAVGKLEDLTLTDFQLATESNTNIQGDAILSGLKNPKNLRFDVIIKSLQTKAEDWKGFLRDTVPTILDNLGTIQYAGKLEGDVYNFELDGKMQTSIGALESDLKVNFTPDYTSGDYQGDLRLINFELDKAFPNNAALGTTSLTVKGKGSGFDLDSLVADAKVVFDSINYNNYSYQNVEVNGEIAEKSFDGSIKLKDKNADLNFIGKVNLRDSIPDFNFVLNMDTLNLQALNITEKPLSMQFKADIDFRGNNISTIGGESIISNFKINNESYEYAEDSIFFSADQSLKEQSFLRLKADFIDANINGEVDIAKLSKIALNYINDFFPIDPLLDSITRTKVAATIGEQPSFTFDIQIDNPTPLTLLFVPQLTNLDEAIIEGHFDRKKQELAIEAIVDNVVFGSLEADQLILNVDGERERLKANLALLEVSTGILTAPLTIFDVNLGEDSLRFNARITGDTLDKRLDIKGIAYDAEQWYEFKLTDEFILNGEAWDVASNNGVYFLNNYLFIDHLKIRQGGHQIAIQSDGFPKETPSTPPINVDFTDFEIADITHFLAIEQNTIAGLINGKFTLKEPFGNAHYVADLQIDELALNEEKIGQFYIDSEQEEGSKTIKLSAGLKGAKNNLSLLGNYAIDQRSFDLKGDIQELEMRLLDPFTIAIISESDGKASGNFTLGGTVEEPDLKGQLNLAQVSTIIDFLGTRILIPEHSLSFDKNRINIGTATVKDVDGQTGILSGEIFHDFFEDFLLNLRFQSESFQVMNTTAEQNPLFFGQLFVSANVYVNGSLELPYIEVNARTLPNSVFTLQPLIESEQIVTDDYILFTTPEKYAEAGEDATSTKYELQNIFNVDLLMNLDVTEDALLKIIIDPLTGDRVEGRGNSNMTIALSPAGDMRILGDYVIEEGAYNFRYQNLVKKNFDIQTGSRVRFTGDPLKAKFDITAAYNVKTTTYELIRNETNFESEGEANAARRRVDVQTLLYLKGLFTKPEITFDIRLEEGIGSGVNSTVSRKLNDLRNDSDEMNKQVFALLLFNSFLASENAGESLADAGQNIALSSVSKLLSNQLNQLAGKYLKGLELSFDLASYQSNFETTAGQTVEVGVGLSQKLFNDRIIIKADADFNLANQSTTAGSNIAGDFVLEYQLTEKGNYILRVFRLSDFDVLTDQNTAKNGIGISFRKSFGNVLKKNKTKQTEKK